MSGKLYYRDASTISQTTTLDSSKLKQFADDNFKFDEIGRKFSHRVENMVFSKDLYCIHVKTKSC